MSKPDNKQKKMVDCKVLVDNHRHKRKPAPKGSTITVSETTAKFFCDRENPVLERIGAAKSSGTATQ